MAVTPSNMMPLGTVAPDFALPDAVSDKVLHLQQLKSSIGTVVMFICNHCPFVIHIQDQLVQIAKTYQAKGLQFIAISSNDIENYPDDAYLENMIGVILGRIFSFELKNIIRITKTSGTQADSTGLLISEIFLPAFTIALQRAEYNWEQTFSDFYNKLTAIRKGAWVELINIFVIDLLLTTISTAKAKQAVKLDLLNKYYKLTGNDVLIRQAVLRKSIELTEGEQQGKFLLALADVYWWEENSSQAIYYRDQALTVGCFPQAREFYSLLEQLTMQLPDYDFHEIVKTFSKKSYGRLERLEVYVLNESIRFCRARDEYLQTHNQVAPIKMDLFPADIQDSETYSARKDVLEDAFTLPSSTLDEVQQNQLLLTALQQLWKILQTLTATAASTHDNLHFIKKVLSAIHSCHCYRDRCDKNAADTSSPTAFINPDELSAMQTVLEQEEDFDSNLGLQALNTYVNAVKPAQRASDSPANLLARRRTVGWVEGSEDAKKTMELNLPKP